VRKIPDVRPIDSERENGNVVMLLGSQSESVKALDGLN
jgi:hypothetical protein